MSCRFFIRGFPPNKNAAVLTLSIWREPPERASLHEFPLLMVLAIAYLLNHTYIQQRQILN